MAVFSMLKELKAIEGPLTRKKQREYLRRGEDVGKARPAQMASTELC